ncbi:LysR substrate-binding domain-containing protein [Salinarimonas chemoclinalis]|uniref:LysR substrate-binding domain-containing protein n=1 Tax=Salinarimonas chemoclinalis TaxID=3241599 RepID=UPI0035585DF1
MSREAHVPSRRLPSLNALRTFEVAARLRSFKRAALELCVTESAVSRQIRSLEDDIGRLLFTRNHRAVALTEAGELLADELRESFERLQHVLAELGRDVATLRVKTLPTFGLRWLLPRIGGFEAQNPKCKIHLAIESSPVDFRGENFDVGIVYGFSPPPQSEGDFLMTERVAPYCAPDLLADAACEVGGGRVRLLLNTPEAREWRQWFGVQGREMPEAPLASVFDTDELAIQAAIAGFGTGLFDGRLIGSELAGGRLVRVGSEPPVTLGRYFLVYPASRLRHSCVRTFRKWILAAAEQTEAAVDTPRLACATRSYAGEGISLTSLGGEVV